ncbi:MAG TPA: hypothetical protein VFW98_01415 [Gemmatimonadaceae bacterium]|nr:hypothetical protein [Gemmatimonadaceae bacterium]
MQPRTLRYVLGAAVLTLGLAACDAASLVTPPNENGTSSGTDPVTSAQEQNDIATQAGNMTANDLILMNGNADAAASASRTSRTAPGLSLSVVGGVLGTWTFPGTCSYDSTTFLHSCTDTLTAGLVLDFSHEFFGSDAPRATFDSASTDSIQFQGHLAGTVSSAPWSATVNLRRALTVAKDPAWNQQRIWNGTGSDTSTVQFSDSTLSRTYALAAASTYSNVVFAVPHTENPWPMSGSVTFTFNGTRTREGNTTVSKTVSYAATLTFNGRSIVPLDIGDTGHFCVDLARRTLVDVSCR